MSSFCLLISMKLIQRCSDMTHLSACLNGADSQIKLKLILMPNRSLLYLHSNDMNSLKSLFLNKKVITINIIIIKTHKQSWCVIS